MYLLLPGSQIIFPIQINWLIPALNYMMIKVRLRLQHTTSICVMYNPVSHKRAKDETTEHGRAGGKTSGNTAYVDVNVTHKNSSRYAH